MIARIFRLSLAISWLLFTAIIVPAHTRGYITWGKSESRESCGSCCGSKSADKSTQPTQEDQKRCAVCFTVALFDAPPAFVLWADYQGDVQRVLIALPAVPALRLIPLTYQSRAPPVYPAST